MVMVGFEKPEIPAEAKNKSANYCGLKAELQLMLDEEVISQEFHNFVLSSLNTFEAIPYPAPFMCRQGDTLVLYWSRKIDGDLFLTLSDDKVYGVFSNPDEWQYWRFGRSAPGLLVMLQHFFNVEAKPGYVQFI